MTSIPVSGPDSTCSGPPVERPPPGVIVTGMHRSGTSMVSSVFAARGWRPPGRLMGATSSNLRGHFEDQRMHDLHHDLLERYATTWDDGPRWRTLRDQDLPLDPGEPVVSEVIASFRDSGGPWMWKNPRSALFLEQWAERFPEARFVICVRAPSAVVDSLWQRKNLMGVPNSVRLFKLRRTARMISLWHSHNLMAHRFATRHPERAVVVCIPQDLGQLAAATVPPLVEPALLHSRARLRSRVLCGFAVSSTLLHRRLRRLSDPARLEALLAEPEHLAQR